MIHDSQLVISGSLSSSNITNDRSHPPMDPNPNIPLEIETHTLQPDPPEMEGPQLSFPTNHSQHSGSSSNNISYKYSFTSSRTMEFLHFQCMK